MHKTYSQRMLCAKALCFASLRFPRFAFVEQRLACQTLKIIGKNTGEVTLINTGLFGRAFLRLGSLDKIGERS